MKQQTAKLLIVISLIGFITALVCATIINHYFNYLPYNQDFETEPSDWIFSNSTITDTINHTGTKSLNLSRELDGNWSFSIFDYNFSLYEKEINFWFRFKEIESFYALDILSIQDPTGLPTQNTFKLWVNSSHKVAASYNFTLTSFLSSYSETELEKELWYYFSIKFRSNDTLVYVNNSRILNINYSLVSLSADFGDLTAGFNIGGSSVGHIYFGKTSKIPFDNAEYEMYYDGFEIQEITYPMIPGYPPIIIGVVSLISIIVVVKFNTKYKVKKSNIEVGGE